MAASSCCHAIMQHAPLATPSFPTTQRAPQPGHPALHPATRPRRLAPQPVHPARRAPLAFETDGELGVEREIEQAPDRGLEFGHALEPRAHGYLVDDAVADDGLCARMEARAMMMIMMMVLSCPGKLVHLCICTVLAC